MAMSGRGTLRRRWRRFSLGVQTLLGRPQGFFSPYRHAKSVVAPEGYPALAPIFEAAFAAEETGGLAVPGDVMAAILRHEASLTAFEGPAPEPRWSQTWYPGLDGAAAYAIVRAARPSRIVEVGSGHSTRFLARAIRDEGLETRLTCIDPEPRARLDGLPVDWQRRVLAPGDAPLYQALGPGDIAFFDSSHLLWPGSDVDFILNGILPALRPGVLVHIHDVFLPDPYPAAWGWRGYTEQLGLGGWLVGGGARLLWSSHYMRKVNGLTAHPLLADTLAPPKGALESALWLIRAPSPTVTMI